MPYSERKLVSLRETAGASVLVHALMFCMLTAAIASAQDAADQHGMPNMPGMSHEPPAAAIHDACAWVTAGVSDGRNLPQGA